MVRRIGLGPLSDEQPMEEDGVWRDGNQEKEVERQYNDSLLGILLFSRDLRIFFKEI